MIAAIEEVSDDDFGIWLENWPAVEAFLAVHTQWRVCTLPDGKAYWSGLDYAGVAAGLTGAGIETSPALWRDLRVMEAAARNALNGIVETD